ncbi:MULTISPECIES: family 20 glycosylhydrolase [unclassified Actinotalea]|uniref:family 20 glycosylhydrolase n=1 Tax=unclassified Actinotalea TaxID=2638618 RepID=UPI0015F4EBF9|nr:MULTISPECIES: family 20 glycosylhydrolase [unclassified Actinotalea]
MAGALGSPRAALPTAADLAVPVPAQVRRLDGPGFTARGGVRVVTDGHPEAVATAVLVAGRLGALCESPVAVVQEDDGSPGAVVLRIGSPADVGLPPGTDPTLAHESYRLEVVERAVTLVAPSGAGLLHGALTLQQIALPGSAECRWEVAAQVVVDVPRFAWRGLGLDVARHFFGVDDVRAVIDAMASLKLNVLHLHLTDDQGWRLDVPSRPALAAASGPTAVGGDPGGAYTAGDWDLILTHAASRHVTVVPEVDVPGHVNAALHALGALNPGGEPAAAYTGTDVGIGRLRADLPATGPFLHDVLGDVAAMTPGPWVHVGADAARGMDPGEYRALVRAAVGEVAAAGKGVVGRQRMSRALGPDPTGAAGSADVDHALEDALAGAVLQYWDEREGPEEVAHAARLGARVVLSPATRVGLDAGYDDGDGDATPGGGDRAGHIDVRDSYDWEPADVLPGVPAGRVLGVEAVLWTHGVRTREDLFLLLLPRLAAVAEVAWSPAERRGWDGFARRLPRLGRRWDARELPWYRSPQVDW